MANKAVGVTASEVSLLAVTFTSEQAATLLHEWSHYIFSNRGLNDEFAHMLVPVTSTLV